MKFIRRIRRIKKKGACPFCKQKQIPDYKDIEILKHYLSERGKILPREDTAICQKHQRELSMAVKRARFLALIPFIVRPS
jgi:small subunit ribosomal protein S18